VGASRYYCHPNEIIESVKKYLQNGKFGDIEVNGGKKESLSHTGELVFSRKQFIPGNEDVAFNSVLKNNFHSSGCYVIEGFDPKKKELENFRRNPSLLENLSQKLQEEENFPPIRLSEVSDRLGSIILQFPVNILFLELEKYRDSGQLEIRTAWHPKLEKAPRCDVLVERVSDGRILGFEISSLDVSQLKHRFDFFGNGSVIKLIRKCQNLVLGHIDIEFLWSLTLAPKIKCFHPRDVDGVFVELYNNEEKVDVNSKAGWFGSYEFLERGATSQRRYKKDRARHEASKSFIQYGSPIQAKQNDREKALDDLRFLINCYGENSVYFWDPYLDACTIKSTLYHCSSINSKMRALASSSIKSSNNQDWKEKQANHLKSSDNFGIDLEFRIVFDVHNCDFHDRFLIFPDFNGSVKAWSLGTSINPSNSIKSPEKVKHYIIQEVLYPQPILDAFNELWNKLDHEKCLVWSSDSIGGRCG
jgi:hypothetical protein